MQTFVTSTMLLCSLRESNDEACWGPFVGRYRPVIEAVARRAGASAEDARDIAQSTMAEFVRAFRAGRYERERGRLRDWLHGIARHVIGRWRRERRPLGALDGADVPDDDADLEAAWEREWREEMLRTALRRVRDEVEGSTFDVFERVAVRGESVTSVAEDLRISANAVYGAKRRVLDRLREYSTSMEVDW